MTTVVECQIQARFRDVNVGAHVDNVEAIRVVDEARIRFFRYAEVGLERRPGLLAYAGRDVVDLVAGHRVDFRNEMPLDPTTPFLVRVWISRIGGSSFSVASEVRLDAAAEPTVVAETRIVCFDRTTRSAWPLSEELRAVLTDHLGEPVALRP